MDPGLRHIYFMIQEFLKQPGHVWWQMSLVLTMAYTFFVRERLLDHNIFDSYPNPLPAVKRRCNDPVLGEIPQCLYVPSHNCCMQTNLRG